MSRAVLSVMGGALALLAAPLSLAAPPEGLADKLTHNGQPMPVASIEESPLSGLYEVRLESGETLYTDADGEYMVVGDLYRNRDGQMVNLTERAANERRQARLDDVPEDERVIYKPAGEVKARITVFTDTSCPYCQKLHKEVPRLNRMGIEVDYLAFPRAGVDSEAARVLSQAWCADNATEALTGAMGGETPDATAQCEAPVAEQYELGRELGIQGTPAIVLPNGRMVPGYVPAERLASMLGIQQ
ncbi:DsbC family protein [Chromohalobacter nigrandesensis]|uniref:DsbC family protein n=1 Tax=Chromohalobacter nigrandesensis TaxID=119863 RepID=UPI001FF4F5CD|nr:DsbC family protein [Chromohalobacter nigrandesensis]MCK0745565.1 DsbC family protein [Chromohalobacter nigrandesensis]